MVPADSIDLIKLIQRKTDATDKRVFLIAKAALSNRRESPRRSDHRRTERRRPRTRTRVCAARRPPCANNSVHTDKSFKK